MDGPIDFDERSTCVKFQVNRDVFSEAVSFAVKLLPQRTTLPILSGVLLEATEGGLTLSSFDYEVSSRTEIAGRRRRTRHRPGLRPAARRHREPAAQRPGRVLDRGRQDRRDLRIREASRC